MKIVIQTKIKNMETFKEEFGAEVLPSREAYLKFCREALNASLENPELQITIHIMHSEK